MNRISQLLLKQLTSSLSPQEREEVNAWIEESEHNRALYERLTSPESVKSSLDMWDMVDGSRACHNMQRRVNARLLPRRILRYAVAVAILLAAVGFAFMINNSPALEETGSQLMTETKGRDRIEEIHPGIKKAMLSDNAGRTMVLNEDDGVALPEKLIAGKGADKHQDLCIDVPRGCEFKILLEDGTEVWLNSDSRLYYPQSFTGGERRVKVEGEAYFHVATDSVKPFYVQSGSQIIRVYGTEFNVRSYPEEGEVYTTLESGSIAISRYGTRGGELFLTPGHQAVYNLADSKVKVQEVDTDVITSWKKGRFVFENQTLLRIMQDLSRWYNFEYEFTEPSLEKEMFMGSIPRYSDFSTAIAILEKCGGINFKYTSGVIMISRSDNKR